MLLIKEIIKKNQDKYSSLGLTYTVLWNIAVLYTISLDYSDFLSATYNSFEGLPDRVKYRY
jgi:hypothetical protein